MAESKTDRCCNCRYYQERTVDRIFRDPHGQCCFDPPVLTRYRRWFSKPLILVSLPVVDASKRICCRYEPEAGA